MAVLIGVPGHKAIDAKRRLNPFQDPGCLLIVVFDYQTSRAGRHAANFLEGWQGHMIADNYAGYKAGYKALFLAAIIELGCMTHARGKFYDLAQASGCPIAPGAPAMLRRGCGSTRPG